MSKRDEIISRIAKVPPLPTASAEVIRLIRDPEVPGTRIAEAIEYDPSLTTNVLRLANSAFFGFPRSVRTVRDAIFRLGTNRVFQLVVAATVARMVQRPIRGYDLRGGDLWDHLIGTAVGSTRLADAVGREGPEHTFTAGLTHDVGKIVLGTFVEVDAEAILALALDERMSFERAEQEVLGIDHAEVGALLLEAWNLPEELVLVARWHHRPESFPGEHFVVDLVHLADVVCMMAGVGAGLDAMSCRPCQDAMARLGATSEMLEKVVYEILKDLIRLRSLFRLDP